MRVALFFDGKNFYENLERARDGRHHLDYGSLAAWLVGRVGGERMTGAHYYTGIPDTLDPAMPEYRKLRGLVRFLDSLEYVEGFFVYRFPRVRRVSRCPSCGASNVYTEEKEVDTTMVADMISLAADNAYDVLILASGDADHAPAVEVVRGMGKVVYLASWGDEAMSPRLRRAAFGHIDLLQECPKEIMGEVVEAEGQGAEGPDDLRRIVVSPELAEQVAIEVGRAQAYFEEHGGYLGRGYFIHRWRGREVPADVDLREAALDLLVEQGRIEEVQIRGEPEPRSTRAREQGHGPHQPQRDPPLPPGALQPGPLPPATLGERARRGWGLGPELGPADPRPARRGRPGAPGAVAVAAARRGPLPPPRLRRPRLLPHQVARPEHQHRRGSARAPHHAPHRARRGGAVHRGWHHRSAERGLIRDPGGHGAGGRRGSSG